MNILVISDIHNDIENLMKYFDIVGEFEFDLIVCPGDFIDVLPKGFEAIDIAKIIIEQLKTFKKPILAIPGNWDKDLLGYFEIEGVNLHGKGTVVDNVGFYGFGGAKTPFNTVFEPTEEEISEGLKNGYEMIKNTKIKIQVTHNPPARTKVDMVYTGAHVGSEAVRKFIEEKRPQLAICAHIHEGRGTDEIENTKIINSGRFPEGYVGLATISAKETSTKIINLNMSSLKP